MAKVVSRLPSISLLGQLGVADILGRLHAFGDFCKLFPASPAKPTLLGRVWSVPVSGVPWQPERVALHVSL